MQVVSTAPNLSTELYEYFNKWKHNSSYKSISKGDQTKFEESMEILSNLENNESENINYSVMAEEYLTLASNIVALKWAKKEPKVRVDINLKCDSWFNKLVAAFTRLVDYLNVRIGTFSDEELHSEKLLKLNEDFQKISILQKILYEYSVALNHGG